MNAMRRRAAAAGALAAAALALGACGGNDPEAGGPPATDVPPTASAPGSADDGDRASTPARDEPGATSSAGSGDGRLLDPADTRRGDGVVFVTSAPTTRPPTTTRPAPSSTTTTSTTSSTTTTSTTTSSTTTSSSTTSSTTTSTVPAPTSVRCSFAADALFDPGEAVLHDDAAAELARLAATVGDDVRLVRVEGRTDHRGSDADNERLSERRAAAAAAALVDADVVEIVAIGEAEARQPGPDHEPTEDEMAEDRRVDVVVEADVAITTRCDAPSGG